MVTSRADRTAPVLRGKWVLENVLGTPPPPPLPNVPPLEGSTEEAPKTLRERMERHRASPTCAGCHKLMDPIGFSLENFDGIGAWRTREAGVPLDASGQLADGTKIDGVVALRNAILARSDVFARTLTEKLMTYATRARAAVLRHAGCQGHRPKSRAAGLPFFRHHHGDRQ